MTEHQELFCSIDLSGRAAGKKNQSWVFSLPVDKPFFYRGVERVVTTSEAKEILSNTTRLQASRESYATGEPLTIPVLINHAPSGPKKGSVVDWKLSGEGSSYGIWLKVKWNKSTWEEILASEYERVSVSLGPHTDMEGTSYPRVLRELSLTHNPVIESLGRIQETLSLQLSQINLTDIEEHDMEEIKAILEGLAARIEALEKASEEEEVEASEEEEKPEEEAPEEANEEEETPEEEEEEVEASNTPEDPSEENFQLSQVLEAINALTEEVQSLKASKVAPLHLSEVGHSGEAPGGVQSFESRVQALMKTGLSRIDAVKKVQFNQ